MTALITIEDIERGDVRHPSGLWLTIRPDEVVVHDDGSVTYRALVAMHGHGNWRLVRGEWRKQPPTWSADRFMAAPGRTLPPVNDMGAQSGGA